MFRRSQIESYLTGRTKFEALPDEIFREWFDQGSFGELYEQDILPRAVTAALEGESYVTPSYRILPDFSRTARNSSSPLQPLSVRLLPASDGNALDPLLPLVTFFRFRVPIFPPSTVYWRILLQPHLFSLR